MDAAELTRRLRDAEERERAREAALASLSALPSSVASAAPTVAPSDVLALAVGGRRFVTTRATLTRVPDTFFCALLSGRFGARTDASGAVFVDRDPAHFPALLEWLRCSAMPEGREARLALLSEADYYGVAPLVRELEVRAQRDAAAQQALTRHAPTGSAGRALAHRGVRGGGAAGNKPRG